MDLVLNNLQWLICHKTQPSNQLFIQSWMKVWIDVFHKIIIVMGKINSLVSDLNSGHRFHFQR